MQLSRLLRLPLAAAVGSSQSATPHPSSVGWRDCANKGVSRIRMATASGSDVGNDKQNIPDLFVSESTAHLVGIG